MQNYIAFHLFMAKKSSVTEKISQIGTAPESEKTQPSEVKAFSREDILKKVKEEFATPEWIQGHLSEDELKEIKDAGISIENYQNRWHISSNIEISDSGLSVTFGLFLTGNGPEYFFEMPIRLRDDGKIIFDEESLNISVKFCPWYEQERHLDDKAKEIQRKWEKGETLPDKGIDPEDITDIQVKDFDPEKGRKVYEIGETYVYINSVHRLYCWDKSAAEQKPRELSAGKNISRLSVKGDQIVALTDESLLIGGIDAPLLEKPFPEGFQCVEAKMEVSPNGEHVVVMGKSDGKAALLLDGEVVRQLPLSENRKISSLKVLDDGTFCCDGKNLLFLGRINELETTIPFANQVREFQTKVFDTVDKMNTGALVEKTTVEKMQQEHRMRETELERKNEDLLERIDQEKIERETAETDRTAALKKLAEIKKLVENISTATKVGGTFSKKQTLDVVDPAVLKKIEELM